MRADDATSLEARASRGPAPTARADARLGVCRLRAQPAHSPSAVITDLAWDADVVRVDQPSSFARSRVHVDPSVIIGREEEGHLHGGAGWDHVRRRRPDEPSRPSSPATNRVAGSELWLSTVTVQLRAFGGTGPAAGGSGVGTGVGLGKTGGGGLGKAGNGGSDTPAGTYSSAAPVEPHTPSSLTVAATRHEDRAVEQERERGAGAAAPKHGRGGRQRPGVWVVQVRTGTGGWSASPSVPPVTSTVPSDNSVAAGVLDAGSYRECGPGSGGRVVHLGGSRIRPPAPCHRAAGRPP